MDNNVRTLREKAGLTQSALAKAVGTSQQQVHRIEQGQAARIDVALRICHALGAPMEKVFPKTRATLRRLAKEGPENVVEKILHDPKAQESLGREGIDADPAQWMLKLQLLSGVTRVYNISGPEHKRLWSILQDGGEPLEQVSFMVFETEKLTVAVNRRAMSYAHLLFDAGFMAKEDEDVMGVSVYFLNQTEPLELDVEADDPPGDADEEDEGQFRNLLLVLDLPVARQQVFVITDVDGETAFIRAENVALIEIPRDLTEGAPDLEEFDGEVGDGSGNKVG
ncbi:helix-turn-helix transcriptional regulator [Myxococcus landrumensis]|uniref:Helix-turn-helix domain-containing protein n=1 Tax=Myxococcus landrumensis TaxID=2813577 RepID=A0ABX7NG82_9BACT|nr:helix-turn-helix domain-containing protein [Myxococcus landrumus]QSQ17466.1 helix-turn-helix domain-containing protein [Myxococcus landrumus]